MHGSILGYRILLDYVFFCALKGAVVGNWIYIYLIDTIGDFYKNRFCEMRTGGDVYAIQFLQWKVQLTSSSSLTSKQTMTSYKNC